MRIPGMPHATATACPARCRRPRARVDAAAWSEAARARARIRLPPRRALGHRPSRSRRRVLDLRRLRGRRRACAWSSCPSPARAAAYPGPLGHLPRGRPHAARRCATCWDSCPRRRAPTRGPGCATARGARTSFRCGATSTPRRAARDRARRLSLRARRRRRRARDRRSARSTRASSSPATSASPWWARRCCASRSAWATCTRASTSASRTSRVADGHRLAGRVSGDSTVAYAWAYAQAAEAVLGVAPPPRALLAAGADARARAHRQPPGRPGRARQRRAASASRSRSSCGSRRTGCARTTPRSATAS